MTQAKKHFFASIVYVLLLISITMMLEGNTVVGNLVFILTAN